MTSFSFFFVFSPSFCLYLWTGSTNTNLPEKYKEPRNNKNNKKKKRIVNIRPVLLDSNTTTGWILLHTLSLFILTFSFFLFLFFLQDAVGYYKEKGFFSFSLLNGENCWTHVNSGGDREQREKLGLFSFFFIGDFRGRLYDDSCHTKRHRKTLWKKKETKRSVSKCVVYLSYTGRPNTL